MTTKEIPEVYKRWIEALRSGKYRQGTRYLKNWKGEYCCLGVLCDIEGIGFNKAFQQLPPREFTNTLGWNEPNSEIFYPPNRIKIQFSILNDTIGLSFGEIADLIEKYWETIE